ncbi:2669_t:CDS:2, partial [Dentiscutata erythropus]
MSSLLKKESIMINSIAPGITSNIDKLYSPLDECSKCYNDLKLWITLKKYLIDEVAKCYWMISDDKELESDSISENLLLDFTNEEREGNTIPFPTEDLNNFPWWLELLEKLSEHYYREFNNFSNTYLCNSIWWKTANPV